MLDYSEPFDLADTSENSIFTSIWNESYLRKNCFHILFFYTTAFLKALGILRYIF